MANSRLIPTRRTLVRCALVWLLAQAGCGGACAQAAPGCPPGAEPLSFSPALPGRLAAPDRGFLWRISKDGHTSYLYGTVHVARFAWTVLGPVTGRALAQSDTMALEIDALDPEVRREMMQGAAARPGDALPAPLERRLRRQARAAGVAPQALSALIPEMQVATLLALAGRRSGLDPAYGIDLALATRGRALNMAIVSLETPEAQLEALQMASHAESVEYVRRSLHDLETGSAEATLRRVAEAWAEADFGSLSRYEAWCDCMNTAADRLAMGRMLEARNPALADSIARLHEAGRKLFAAVGSLHMVGPLGLPELMRRRGFLVIRLDFRADTNSGVPSGATALPINAKSASSPK